MKHKLFSLIALLFIAVQAISQEFPYRTSQNPDYWANRKPYPGYWQQDVYYNIHANIDEKTDILSGDETLLYWNNSPDLLPYVYFHLYQNAYQPGSYLDNNSQATGRDFPFGSYEKQGKCIKVDEIKVNGQVLKTELDNTILKVYLNEPLGPGQAISFDIKFTTWFDIGAQWRRMRVYDAYGFKHYNGGQWYPRISVYDHKFGWTADQHLGHEFYGDFGVYDVELTFANNFVVDATGMLQNKNEVLPDDLRQRLDISNFKDKPLESPPSVVIPYDSTVRKTWKFHAENVHDFAFVADPTFRIGEENWNGIQIIALAQEPHAAKWQDAAAVTKEIIQFYSDKIGMYSYPKMIVADAESGMEYPMLTMDGELSPDYIGLFAHEVGHNWFFGMVGNNETYAAPLDEGFTQFITLLAVQEIQKTRVVSSPEPGKYDQKYRKQNPVVLSKGYERYLNNAIQTNGNQLNTHSDYFDTKDAYGMDYRQVYNKTVVMLYNLQYVLGDELFMQAMQHYFNQWKFCHPYLEDFRNSIINYTGVDLNWFFDQWLNTTKTVDYAVKSLKKGKKENEYLITFKRKGLMQMPIDFNVYTNDGNSYSYYIPNRDFVKKTDATILPKWLGWNYLDQEYTASVIVPEKIVDVVIDTTNRLADINMMDNRLKFNLDLNFDMLLDQPASWVKYDFYGRPDIWWNGFDGVKFGGRFHGDYMKYKYQLDAGLWFNTGFGKQIRNEYSNSINNDNFSFQINFKTPLTKITKNTFLTLKASHYDGVYSYGAGIEQLNKDKTWKYYLNLSTLYINDSSKLNYFLYPFEWSLSPFVPAYNTNFKLGAEKKLKFSKLNLSAQSSIFTMDYNYFKLNFEAVDKRPLGKLKLNTRFFAQYGSGTKMPKESSLYLAGGSPEEMLDNPFTCAYGFIPDKWVGYGNTTNHFQYGGGMNLRGYAGYLIPYTNSEGVQEYFYRSHSGFSVNGELEFDGLVRFRPKFLKDYLKLNTYLFGDAGMIGISPISKYLQMSDLKADAGVGAALTIKKWGPFETIKPLTIRFDMPWLLTCKPNEEKDFVQFRYVVGVNRAF